MRDDRIEPKWIDSFRHVFELCEVKRGDEVAILSETQSRQTLVQLAEIALHQAGARLFHVMLPTPALSAPVPVRSTGSSNAIQMNGAVISALANATMVVDITVEGLLHARELPEILKPGRARVLYVSSEHPEAFERLPPSRELAERVKRARKLLAAAKTMRVTSKAGADLTIDVSAAPCGASKGFVTRPGEVDHLPGGLVVCFPRANSVNGVLVMDGGDINLTFKRYLETPIRLTIENDFVTDITGAGPDADLMRSYLAAWGERNAYATSHVGWGMNQQARWDSLTMYDKHQTNGVEQRAFAGNFLYSTGANEHAQRHTLGHFDLPIRNCTIALDGRVIVENGNLVGELA
jgi:2,5-dihydroxypyridine 5,6-dioxygenase